MVARHLVLAALCCGSSIASAKEKAKLCPSPGGWHPCECIHEVESGSRIDEVLEKDGTRHAILNHANGTVEDLPQCAHEAPPRRRPNQPLTEAQRGRAGDAPLDPCKLGWGGGSPLELWYLHSKDIKSYTAYQTVPESPKNANDNILYYWIGLQDTNSTKNPVIQPVLSYVPGSDPNNWYFESWNCCPAGHKVKSTSVPIKDAGAKVTASMHRDENGLFTINSTDSTGRSSVLYSNDTKSGIVSTWNWVEILLETYNINTCDDYSAGGKAEFLHMELIDVEGKRVRPKWTNDASFNGTFLNKTEAAVYAGCCNGKLKAGWPRVVMEQNRKKEDEIMTV